MNETIEDFAQEFSKVLYPVSESVRDSLQLFMNYYHYWFPGPFAADVVGGMMLSLSGYWMVASLFAFVDLCRWPKFIYQYRIHDKEITLDQIWQAAKASLFNQITVQLGCTLAFHYMTHENRWWPSDRSSRVPPLSTIVFHLAVCQLIHEIMFYYTHRLMHQNWFLYQRVHKVHHLYREPFAISAFDCHPVEHLFGNMIPVLTGPFLLGSHRGTIFVWLFLIHLFSLSYHCGYRLPFLPSPDFHDFHHNIYSENYGWIGLLDHLHGTNKRYLKKNSQNSKQE